MFGNQIATTVFKVKINFSEKAIPRIKRDKN